MILVEFGHGLNGLEVHVPLELLQARRVEGWGSKPHQACPTWPHSATRPNVVWGSFICEPPRCAHHPTPEHSAASRDWQSEGNKVGYAFFYLSILDFFEGTRAFMTSRVSYAPQDLQKMCKQAERDQESKKLAALMDRVKRQIAEREDPALTSQRPKAAKGVSADKGLLRLPSKSVPLER